MKTRPDKFGPEIISNDSWVWCNQCSDGTRRRETATGIKTLRNPVPFLAIAKKETHDSELPIFRPGRERITNLLSEHFVGVCPLTNPHAINSGDEFCCHCSCPLSGRGDRRRGPAEANALL